jgi:hypothetical protein
VANRDMCHHIKEVMWTAIKKKKKDGT